MPTIILPILTAGRSIEKLKGEPPENGINTVNGCRSTWPSGREFPSSSPSPSHPRHCRSLQSLGLKPSILSETQLQHHDLVKPNDITQLTKLVVSRRATDSVYRKMTFVRFIQLKELYENI